MILPVIDLNLIKSNWNNLLVSLHYDVYLYRTRLYPNLVFDAFLRYAAESDQFIL